MTRQHTPNICDFCGKSISSEMEYSVQINQKKGGKGKFIKAENKADMCQDCFLFVCKNGYKPNWKTLIKNDTTGVWEEQDQQETLDERTGLLS